MLAACGREHRHIRGCGLLPPKRPGGCGHRLAAANLALSRILLAADSAEQWKRYHGYGRKYAVASRDTSNILECINQYALFQLIYSRDSLNAARLAAGTLRNKGYCRYLSRPLLNSFCQIAAEGYTGSEKTDSALVFADMMVPANIVDSMAYYDILSKIMEAGGDFDKAFDYGRRAYELESTINRKSDVLNLSAHEHEIQSSYERMLGRHRISILELTAVLLSSFSAVMTAAHIRTRKSRQIFMPSTRRRTGQTATPKTGSWTEYSPLSENNLPETTGQEGRRLTSQADCSPSQMKC